MATFSFYPSIIPHRPMISRFTIPSKNIPFPIFLKPFKTHTFQSNIIPLPSLVSTQEKVEIIEEDDDDPTAEMNYFGNIIEGKKVREILVSISDNLDSTIHSFRSQIERLKTEACKELPDHTDSVKLNSIFRGRKEETTSEKQEEVTAVEVNPKPTQGVASKLMDYLEELIVKLTCDSPKHHRYLSGNFTPAPDETTTPIQNLPVNGNLPDCLNGEFLRIGPNPKFAPVAGYHWFDGDGMIHGVRVKDGAAAYVRRYVRTSRLKQEELLGGAKFLKLGDLKGLPGLLMVAMAFLRGRMEVLDSLDGDGTGNTNLIYHHGKLLALHERDKPYVVEVMENGDLHTIGLTDFDKRLNHSFTAHPKVDPFTGEMFTFGYSYEQSQVTYRVISKNGIMDDPVQIRISNPIMMHDFAITENYAIFMDLPLRLQRMEMVTENQLAYSFDATKRARFGILPRYAKDDSQIKWFELPNCHIFHNANAWEEKDEIVLISCRIQNLNFEIFRATVEEDFEDPTDELYEMRFNMKTGVASQKKLSASAVDFPKVNDRYTGRKQRYVYGAILENAALVKGLVKFDLHAEPERGKEKIEVGGNVVGIFDLGPGRFGSEAAFVPRESRKSEEDDGYLIFFVHDENTGKSSMNVIDAKTMSADPVAVVELPHRIPCGFHAFFLSDEQLQEQAKP